MPLMEPVDERCGNNYFSNHYQLGLLSATTLFISFIYLFILKVLRLAVSWEIIYILCKQKDRNGVLGSDAMQNPQTTPRDSVSGSVKAV